MNWKKVSPLPPQNQPKKTSKSQSQCCISADGTSGHSEWEGTTPSGLVLLPWGVRGLSLSLPLADMGIPTFLPLLPPSSPFLRAGAGQLAAGAHHG